MQHSHNAYRRQAQTAWTRIDMLLAVYEVTIESLDNGIDLLNRQDMTNYPTTQLRATQCLLALLEGIHVGSSEVAGNIHDLCVFSINQIVTPSAQSWSSAREVMVLLRDAFMTIRTEGIQLEVSGVIPALSMVTSHTVLHA